MSISKTAKRLFAAFAALVMALAVVTPTFAAEGGYTITITGSSSGHTYEAYQIFAGDLYVNDDEDKVLSNIKWGDGVTNTDALLEALQKDETIGYVFAGCMTAADVADVLAEFNDNSTQLDAFAAVVGNYLNTTSGSCDSGAEQSDGAYTYTISDVAAGYYLVKDKDSSLSDAEGEAYTKFIVAVVGEATVNVKSDVPTLVKKVKDTNDSTGDDSTWQDSADYDIGDSVPFQLTVTVADNYADYDSYSLTIHDTLDAGLSFDGMDSVTVTVGNTTISADYYQVVTTTEDECDFHIVFNNLKSIGAISAGSQIIVEYSASLNTNATIGANGNRNVAYLEYSNNPNGNGTGKTVADTVTVYTYEVVVKKTDGTNPLAGAAFKLEKFVASVDGQDSYNGVVGDWTVVKEISAGQNTTDFTFGGLDDGCYRLTETTTPDGYNTIDPIYFTIEATHSDGDTQTLSTLTSNNRNFIPDMTIGTLTTTVVNKAGSTLPSTGGMGTTILYAVGAVLVIGAGVTLVVRRRAGVNA